VKRLTTPEEMTLTRRLYPTGNHFVSLPVVAAEDASVDRVGVLHMGLVSLIELCGRQAGHGAETLPPLEPLLRPFAIVQGRKVRPGAGPPSSGGGGGRSGGGIAWRRLWSWVPCFQWREPQTGLLLKGVVCAPVRQGPEGVTSHKGFFYLLEAELPSGAVHAAGEVALGLDITWADLVQTVYTSRPLKAHFSVRGDRWTGGPVLEPRSGAGAGPVAMALSFSVGPDEVHWSVRQDFRRDVRRDGDGAVRIEIVARPAGPGPDGRVRAAFYFGVSREGDGARTVAVDLARHGWERLLEETGRCLGAMRRKVGAEAAPDAAGGVAEASLLEERLNLNLMFNYFFSVGRTVDTEELVLVTSRSPLYYVSAAFWARDALLWSLPGLLLSDPGLAEEALGAAFERYFRHAGTHSLYIDGTLLYPGFELDELAAYPIALWRYVVRTGDRAVLARRGLGPKLRRLCVLLAARKHPDPSVDLYETFLLPSDDPASHPYVTYDNVLAWRALLALADLLAWQGAPAEEVEGLRAQAGRVRESVYRHCVVDGPHGPMFAWSVDLKGGAETGDEPPGSLELLPYYGFCARDDRIWRNTMRWLHSREHPYRYVEVPFPGLGCPHSPHPFVMSLFNALLGGLPERVREAREVLLQAPLDTGLACESFDRHTGEVKTGAAFASCAGFLAYAMDAVFGPERLEITGTVKSLWNNTGGED
jgi:hypothetical protein